MTDERLRALIRLNLADGIGPILCKRLVDKFGAPECVFEVDRRELLSVEGLGPKLAAAIHEVDENRVDEEIKYAEKNSVRILGLGDDEYPAALSEIPDPPLLLYVRGTLLPRDELAVGMVGMRNPSFYGQKQARRLACGLAANGVTVISGMARGIDTACHEGALEAGGRTIAVLGTGLGVVYPPENADLYIRIAGSGAVVSEFPMRTPVLNPGQFPRRNRIISGMSLGVVVVEAGLKSGALITARHAMEQGRDVFAVPGMVDAAGARGCHRLIRDGAKLVEDPADILEELGPMTRPVELPELGMVSRPQAAALNDVEKAVYAQLDGAPCMLDELAERSGLGVSQVTSALTILEMRRLVRRLPGPSYARS